MLHNVGQSLQFVVLIRVLEVQCRGDRGLQIRAIVHRIEGLIQSHRRSEPIDRRSDRRGSAKIIEREADRRRRIRDGRNLVRSIVGCSDGPHR